jgi:hypothetical protein
MSRVDLMKEAIQLAEAEKKIAKELPSFMITGVLNPKPHKERMKEIESLIRPMFRRNIFLERYVHNLRNR